MTDAFAQAIPAIARWLANYGEPYAIVGGLAVVLRARPRLTQDIDLVVNVPSGALPRLIATAVSHGLTSTEDALPDSDEEGLLRLRFAGDREGGLGVDVMYSADPASARLLARATLVSVAGCNARVATVEDLILMKLEANRPQALDDVLALRDAAGSALDRSYLFVCAAELDLVDRVRAFVG